MKMITMFLNSNYVMASELTQKMDINISNISMIHKKFKDEENYSSIVKMGSSLFIDKTAELPKYIRLGIDKYDFTDISCMLPSGYVQSEFNLVPKEITKLIQDCTVSEFVGSCRITDKLMIQFSKEFVEKIKDYVVYPLNYNDTIECLINGDIKDCIELTKNKYLTWYDARGY
jgi:hypothetical protein